MSVMFLSWFLVVIKAFPLHECRIMTNSLDFLPFNFFLFICKAVLSYNELYSNVWHVQVCTDTVCGCVMEWVCGRNEDYGVWMVLCAVVLLFLFTENSSVLPYFSSSRSSWGHTGRAVIARSWAHSGTEDAYAENMHSQEKKKITHIIH